MVIEVEGGSKAAGELTIQGAKNAVLPMIAATVLCRESVVLEGCPKIRDVDAMTSILKEIGADVTWDGDRLIINAASADGCEISGKAAGEVRASVLFLGSMLGRNREAGICLPGGCSIGARPVDYHVAAFEKLGAAAVQKNGKICCSVERAGEEVVELPYPSVGATENIILFSVLRDGRTELRNAAKEPEIVELCCFLRSMGARLSGEGSGTILICGVKQLHGTAYRLKSDRIVFLTYAAMAAATGGEAVFHVYGDTFRRERGYLEQAGCLVEYIPDEDRFQSFQIKVSGENGIRAVPYIRTGPYPEFPTDAQSLFLALLSKSYGESIIEESVFENRFLVASQLRKMGADIEVAEQRACVRGVSRLHGETVCATDLRSGAALLVAAATAEGTTRILDSDLILRGYERPVEKMNEVGIRAKM